MIIFHHQKTLLLYFIPFCFFGFFATSFNVKISEAPVHRCSKNKVLRKSGKTHKKTPVLEPLLNKAAALYLQLFLKKDSNRGVFV